MCSMKVCFSETEQFRLQIQWQSAFQNLVESYCWVIKNRHRGLLIGTFTNKGIYKTHKWFSADVCMRWTKQLTHSTINDVWMYVRHVFSSCLSLKDICILCFMKWQYSYYLCRKPGNILQWLLSVCFPEWRLSAVKYQELCLRTSRSYWAAFSVLSKAFWIHPLCNDSL